MCNRKVEYILLDAANTLIHKPTLWIAIKSVLATYGHNITDYKLKLNHKLLSEVINFPDRTSKDFYNYFNNELLLSLGILPSKNILDDIFKSCNYLPWECFNDTAWINNCKLPVGVLSNFNNNLPEILSNSFSKKFSDIIVSEKVEIRKPAIAFYQYALDIIGVPANKILYIGDSIKLDILPAKALGFNAYLIDRLNIYNHSTLDRFTDLKEVILYL